MENNTVRGVDDDGYYSDVPADVRARRERAKVLWRELAQPARTARVAAEDATYSVNEGADALAPWQPGYRSPVERASRSAEARRVWREAEEAEEAAIAKWREACAAEGIADLPEYIEPSAEPDASRT